MPATTIEKETHVIVVGVDGSTESQAALRWAMHEARLRHTPLRAVLVWQLPVLDKWGYLPSELLDLKGMAARARAALDTTIASCADDLDGVPLECVTPEGMPARALLDEARDAELLVVGSRGHGGFSGLLLGSVSRHCVIRAACPVVVVHSAGDVPA